MTEAQRLVKDSVLSIVTVDNFAERVVSGNYYRTRLPSVANRQWWLDFRKQSINGMEYLSIYIRIGEIYSWKYSTEVGITLKNENSKASETHQFIRDYLNNGSWGCHRFIKIREVLAKNSGFLRNGALTVQCEVRVNAITDNRGIRKFNFHDPFEGCVRFKREHGEKTYYAMKEMVMYHSPVLAEKIANGEEEFTFSDYSVEGFEWFLRLIHGGLSAGQLPEWTLSGVLDYAVQFDTFDVIKRSEALFSKTLNKVHVSAKFELIRLKRQFQSAKSLEVLKEVVEEHDWNDFDSEMMETVVSKFFSLAVDFRGPDESGKRRKSFFSRVMKTLTK